MPLKIFLLLGVFAVLNSNIAVGNYWFFLLSFTETQSRTDTSHTKVSLTISKHITYTIFVIKVYGLGMLRFYVTTFNCFMLCKPVKTLQKRFDNCCFYQFVQHIILEV